MIRVKWQVGRVWWHQDFGTESEAQAKVDSLLGRGFSSKSKAGVVTNYPAHRISKIVRRVLKRAA